MNLQQKYYEYPNINKILSYKSNNNQKNKVNQNLLETQKDCSSNNLHKTSYINNHSNKDSRYSSNVSSENKEIEIINHVVGKIPNAQTKNRKILNRNASCENIKPSKYKNKEVEIFLKINNFNSRYDRNISNELMTIMKQVKNNKNSSLPHMKKKLMNMNTNTPIQSANKKQMNYRVNKGNTVTNQNNKPNSLLNKLKLNAGNIDDLNIVKTKENYESLNKSYWENNNINFKNLINLSQAKKSPSKTEKQIFMEGLYDNGYENYLVTDEDAHLPTSILDDNYPINKNLAFQSKPHLSTNEKIFDNVQDKNKVIIEAKTLEEKSSSNIDLINQSLENKNSMLLSSINNNIKNYSTLNKINTNHNNQEMLKAMLNLENEFNKSALKSVANTKSNIMKDDIKKFENYDLRNLSYDLIKEYSHLKIDKEEEFMRRMLFDVFKRQTKDLRLGKIIEQNKVKINENECIKTFNRLIDDANRRLEAQEKLEDLQNKINNYDCESKKISQKKWGEIYKARFMNYQTYKENWLKEKQTEKIQLENQKELEVINNCKTVKKPKKNLEEFTNRMHEDAKRRQNIMNKNIERKEAEENSIIVLNNDDCYNQIFKKKILGKKDITKLEKENIIHNVNPNNKKVDFNTYNNILEKENFNSSKNASKSFEKINNNLNSNNYMGNSNINHNEDKKSACDYEKKLKETILSGETRPYQSLEVTKHKDNKTNILLKSTSNENIFSSNKKFNLTPSKPLNQRANVLCDSDKMLSNTEINNLRFNCDLQEEKKPVKKDSFRISSLLKNNDKDCSALIEKNDKCTSKVEDNSSNLFSANVKNMKDIVDNVFEIHDEEIIKEVPKPYKIKPKKPSYKIVPISFSNTQMKFMPDHVAFKVVDNILNPKIFNE